MGLFELRPTLVHRALARGYGAISRLRNLAYDRGWLVSEQYPAFVICVGNVTVGGSGKSPLAQYLCRELLKRGERPVLLSRGYGGRLSGPHIVSGGESVSDVGDEALMHRTQLPAEVPVVIARARAEGVATIIGDDLGRTVVLDDGFQHRQLDRDVNLLLCDCQSLISGGFYRQERFVPAGRLREHPLTALARTHAVVVVDDRAALQEVPRELRIEGRVIPVFRVAPRLEGMSDVVTGREESIERMSQESFSLVAGIERPERFFRLARDNGVQVRSEHPFPDHYVFDAGDWEKLQINAPLMCTAKDAVKLRPLARRPGELFLLRMGLEFVDRDEAELWDFLRTMRAEGSADRKAIAGGR